MARPSSGGLIVAVAGAARIAGIRRGDRLLAVDGHRLRDVVDFSFYADGPAATFRLLRDAEEVLVRVERPAAAGWGIEFADPLFDGVRRCTNRCLFCFLDQLPPGWRRSIYLRDDDYRLSFLHGNFITLTNLRREDWHRLAEQRLSPLYVSVHATEPALRRRLLGGKEIPDVRRQLAQLGRLGITVHTQVVLCPGINDGEHLEKTVADLARLHPAVQSVALVPVGLTRFRTCPPAGLEGISALLRSYAPAEAQALLYWAAPRQREFRCKIGQTFLYLADEFYLLAGRPVPSAARYDGFPQGENGVGLVRLLLDEWAPVRRRVSMSFPRPLRITLVSGTLIAPLLRRLGEEMEARLPGFSIQILPLENRTFGPTVTVSGLLTGETFLQGLKGVVLGDLVFLPRAAFDEQREYTLDDVSVDSLREELGRPIVLVERMGEVVRALEAR